jgi:DNA-binding transcriptional LysR family regulator
MALLQKECGAKLYSIMGQGIKLTPEGRQLLALVQPALREIERIERRFIDNRSEMLGKVLKIGGSESSSAALLPKAIALFRGIQPDTRVLFLTADNRTLERKVLTSELEIAVITEFLDNPAIVVEPFRSERVVAIASAKLALPKKRQLTLKDLAKLPCIRKVEGRITHQIEQAGISLNFVLECQSNDALKAAAEAGLGVAFFAYDEVAEELSRGLLKRVRILGLGDLDFRRFIAYRRGEALSRAARVFREVLTNMSNTKAFHDTNVGANPRRTPTLKTKNNSKKAKRLPPKYYRETIRTRRNPSTMS